MGYPISINFMIKFCSSAEDFILIVRKLWWNKDGKNWRFICTHVVDFCRPGHIFKMMYKTSISRGGWTRSHAPFICIMISIHLYICKKRALCDQFWYGCTCNDYPDKLPRVTRFMLFYIDLVSCDVHSCRQFAPKCNCASRKQQDTTGLHFEKKVSPEYSVPLGCMLVLFIRMRKGILIK